MIFGIHCAATAVSPPLLLCERKSTVLIQHSRQSSDVVSDQCSVGYGRGRVLTRYDCVRVIGCVMYFIMRVLQLILLNIIICALILYGIYNKVILSPV